MNEPSEYQNVTILNPILPGTYTFSVNGFNRGVGQGVQDTQGTLRVNGSSDSQNFNFYGYIQSKQSKTFTVPDNGVTYSLLLYAGTMGNTAYKSWTWKKVKLESGTTATDWSPSPQDTIDALTGIGTDISGLQAQIDGKIVAYWQTSDPSTGWTAQQKSDNTGDMWYDTDATTNALKRWNGTGWDVVSDDSAVKAYKLASTAKDTADGKRRVFVSTPTTPYNVGDLWTGGPTGDLRKCKVERLTGSYTASDWELASKYTDDSALTNFVNNTYTPAISVKK